MDTVLEFQKSQAVEMPPRDFRECCKKGFISSFDHRKPHLCHLCGGHTMGSSFKCRALDVLGPSQLSSPHFFLCAFSLRSARRQGSVPLLNHPHPCRAQLFWEDEGTIPQGPVSPPLIINVYHSHMVCAAANYCLQKLSAFTEKAESNHHSIFESHPEQNTSYQDTV